MNNSSMEEKNGILEEERILEVGRILVVGCGGTGSEVIKMICNESKDVTVVDDDRVALTDLCRQFYYRNEDIGKYKAEIIGKLHGIKYHTKRIQELGESFINEYDIIFCCVDNIETRMDINYLFNILGSRSNSRIMIDLGVDGFQCHVKKVSATSTCLYCIRELYRTETIGICTLSGTSDVTDQNRTRILKSLIHEYEKETNQEISDRFNKKCTRADLYTNEAEISFHRSNSVSNTATINSICASIAIQLISDPKHDFLFYNGNKLIHISKHAIEKRADCLACRNQKTNQS